MDQKSSKPSQKRRAILQGSLAAPVVLTVSSPMAAQAASLACIEKPIAQPPPQFISASPDGWLRQRVDVFKLKKGQGQGQGQGLQETDWVYFDEGLQDYVTVASPNTRMNIGPLLKGYEKTASETRWSLVWVDEKTGMQYSRVQIQQPSGSTDISTSCWNSLHPAG